MEELEAEDFPDDFFTETNDNINENRLFHYFTSKINEVLEFAKVYKEYKSNTLVWTEWMRRIFESAQKKEEIKMIAIAKSRKSLEKAYRQSHEIYMEVMKRKASSELNLIIEESPKTSNKISFSLGNSQNGNQLEESPMSEKAKKKISWIKEIIE